MAFRAAHDDTFVFLIYFVCINVSFIVIQYIHAERSDQALDPGATRPADMKTDGVKYQENEKCLCQEVPAKQRWDSGAGPRS